MPIGWFIAPYRLKSRFGATVRYCSVDDYTQNVVNDGGAWAEIECLGTGPGQTIVKVRASAATLTQIANDPDITRVPIAQLDTNLSALTNQQKTAISNKLQSLGYTIAEIQAAVPGNLGNYTLRDILRFALTKRKKARFDINSNSVICDGPTEACDPIEQIDNKVT